MGRWKPAGAATIDVAICPSNIFRLIPGPHHCDLIAAPQLQVLGAVRSREAVYRCEPAGTLNLSANRDLRFVSRPSVLADASTWCRAEPTRPTRSSQSLQMHGTAAATSGRLPRSRTRSVGRRGCRGRACRSLVGSCPARRQNPIAAIHHQIWSRVCCTAVPTGTLCMPFNTSSMESAPNEYHEPAFSYCHS